MNNKNIIILPTNNTKPIFKPKLRPKNNYKPKLRPKNTISKPHYINLTSISNIVNKPKFRPKLRPKVNKNISNLTPLIIQEPNIPNLPMPIIKKPIFKPKLRPKLPQTKLPQPFVPPIKKTLNYKIRNYPLTYNKENCYRTHYIITRFSIFDYDYKGFIITKVCKNIDQYKNELFKSERLNFKFHIFEKITLPSLLNQTNKNYVWLIYSSIYLPEVYKEKLNSLTNNYPNIQVIYVNNFNDMNENINSIINTNEFYTTSRLDDDDELANNFISTLNTYNNVNNIQVISFPLGRDFILDSNLQIIYRKTVFIKNIAIGLTAFNMNIYLCGNHSQIHNKYLTYYNSNIPMYSVCCSEYCDSKRL